MPASASTAWQPLSGLPPMAPGALAETLDGGQSFRWHRLSPPASSAHGAGGVPSPRECGGAVPSPGSIPTSEIWHGTWSDYSVQVGLAADGTLRWRAAAPDTTPAAVAAYFALDRDFAALADALPWRSDAHLARCLGEFRGLRILRQPFGETLLGFLCSATKQIVQIKQMLALLAERHGAVVAGAESAGGSSSAGGAAARNVLHRLPTWPELARVPEAELRACLLGFRARYLADTARFLAANPGWLEETEHLPYVAAKPRLCSLPGVGEKIADCVLLFGAGRLEAFPVDTWILKALARHYGLEGWKPAQVAHFGRTHFGPLAGFAQQFLFAWERRAAARPDHRPA